MSHQIHTPMSARAKEDHRLLKLIRSSHVSSGGIYGGPPSLVAPNRLKWQFTVDGPDKAWVTDLTYIRTWRGWLYLAVVMDLFARRIIGWSMKLSLARELVLDAIVMAVWRRRPGAGLIIHSDQGSHTAVTTSSGSAEHTACSRA